VSGDKASGDWTPWPAVDGQLELDVFRRELRAEFILPTGSDWPRAAEEYDFHDSPEDSPAEELAACRHQLAQCELPADGPLVDYYRTRIAELEAAGHG
jgi:hypothetical protein